VIPINRKAKIKIWKRDKEIKEVELKNPAPPPQLRKT